MQSRQARVSSPPFEFLLDLLPALVPQYSIGLELLGLPVKVARATNEFSVAPLPFLRFEPRPETRAGCRRSSRERDDSPASSPSGEFECVAGHLRLEWIRTVARLSKVGSR